MLEHLFNPASIVVLGASADTGKPSGKIVENLLGRGYAGQLFLVNPKASTIQGQPVYQSLKHLPLVPDLAYIAIPAPFVASALAELADFGVRQVIVLSSGFGEIDAQGRAEELKLAGIADENRLWLLGPNCLGIMSPFQAGKFAGLLPEMCEGGLDFISGSGATMDYLAEQAVSRGLRFHAFVSVGNSVRNGVTDILALYDAEYEHLNSKIIMLYLEKIGDPAKLLQHARSLTARGCQLIGIKAGVTEAGTRAAASHTGAMVTSDLAVQALFDKAGLIRVQSRLELVDLAAALVLAKGQQDGRRCAIITDAGGPGVMLADELNRLGLAVPPLNPETRRQLAQILPPGAGLGNPVDCLPSRTPAQIARIIEILNREEAEALDYLLVVLGDPGFTDNWDLYQAVGAAMDSSTLPVFPSFCTVISSATALEKFRQSGRCYFQDEVSMARAISRMVNRPQPRSPEPDPPGYFPQRIKALLDCVQGPVPPSLVRQVLQAAGIPVPAQSETTRPDEMDRLPGLIPWPWVMKVIGPLHKTEQGGVITGIQNLTQARAAWDRLIKVDQVVGVMIQETITGTETILGLSREEAFGHLTAFGLGGIQAEALGDVRFALAPLSREEAHRLIQSIRARNLLVGFRGQAGVDLNILADLLVRVSLLGRDVPGIREMDINPLKGTGAALVAVDVRLILDYPDAG